MKKSVENPNVGWRFWLQWVLASMLGVTIGQVIGRVFVLGFELFLIQGASVGLMQWLILRKKVPNSGWWILTTTIGFGFGFMVSQWAPITQLQYVLAWAIAGFIQWLSLRKKVARAGWWIPATSLALSMAVIANYMGLQWKFPYEIVNSLGLAGIRPSGDSFRVTTDSPAGQALPLVRMGIRLILWYLAEAFMGIVLTWQLRHFSKKTTSRLTQSRTGVGRLVRGAAFSRVTHASKIVGFVKKEHEMDNAEEELIITFLLLLLPEWSHLKRRLACQW